MASVVVAAAAETNAQSANVAAGYSLLYLICREYEHNWDTCARTNRCTHTQTVFPGEACICVHVVSCMVLKCTSYSSNAHVHVHMFISLCSDALMQMRAHHTSCVSVQALT